MAIINDLVRVHYNATGKKICLFLSHTTFQDSNMFGHTRSPGVLHNFENTHFNNVSIQSKRVQCHLSEYFPCNLTEQVSWISFIFTIFFFLRFVLKLSLHPMWGSNLQFLHQQFQALPTEIGRLPSTEFWKCSQGLPNISFRLGSKWLLEFDSGMYVKKYLSFEQFIDQNQFMKRQKCVTGLQVIK